MLDVVARFAAGHAAADIGVMRDRRRERDQAAFVENRRRDRAVVEMRDADDIGIIGQERIAGLQRFERKALEDRVTSRSVEPRCAGALVISDSARPLASQSAVEQSARSLIFGENAVRTRLAAISCVAASKAAAMISSWRGPWWSLLSSQPGRNCSRNRFQTLSTRPSKSGGTTVVASICSTIAGPWNDAPGASAPRS